MNVPIIGTPGCGRAVFIGLLYETLIRMSTAEGDEAPQVIVNVGPVEAKVLGDLRIELLSGRWPSAELGSRVSGCALELGFQRKAASFFRGRELHKVRLEGISLSEKDIEVMRGSGQLREVRQGSPGSSIDRFGLSEKFRDSLESEAIILLADISPGSQDVTWPGGERDAFLATIVDNASKDRLGRKRKVDVLVVLTKGDRAEVDVQKLFEEMYPRTARSMRKADTGDEAGPNVIVSWMNTVPNANGVSVPATKVSEGQVQIDYFEKEYRRLIERIGKFA